MAGGVYVARCGGAVGGVVRRWVYFLGALVVVAATCVYATSGALSPTTASADGTGVGLEWSGPPGINDGVTVNDVSCVSSTFCMAIGNWTAEGGSDADVTTFDGNSWSDPTSALTSDGLTSLSCTSDTFCMATGWDGTYMTFNGSTWSASGTIVPPPAIFEGTTDVSCASPLLCVAVSLSSNTVYTYDGSTWSQVPSFTSTSSSLPAVSCAAPSLCVVSAGGILGTFDGTTWTTTTGGYDLLSCGAPSLCVGINLGNDVQVFDGSSWTDDGVVDAANPIIAVSCSGPSYCAAVDESGNVVQYDGTSWTVGPVVEARNYPSAPPLELVSCASSTFCVTIDEDGNAFYNSGGTWTSNTTTTEDANGLRLSCPSTTFCLGLDPSTGDALTFDGTNWTGPATTPFNGAASTASCPTSTFCMGVEGGNQGYIDDGSSWSPTPALTGAELSLVSCPTAGSCVSAGYLYTYVYSDGTWSQISAKTSTILFSLSCASMTFCGATDEYGNLYIFNGTSWAKQSGVLPSDNSSNYAAAISCPAVGFCMAVDVFGDAVVYQDGSWSVSPIGAEVHGFTQDFRTVSCATTSFCVALNADGTTVVDDGGTWTQIVAMGSAQQTGNGGADVSCPTTTFCVGMDSAGLVQYLYPDTTAISGGATVTSASPSQTVTYSANVDGASPDLIAGPTGQVEFSVDSTPLCSASVADGTASCTSDAAPIGDDTVSAQYSGDIYHAASADDSQLLVGSSTFGPPTVSIISPGAGAVYGIGKIVPADYSCKAAAGTTLSSCTGPVASGADIGTSVADVGVHQFSVEAMDGDGQSTTAAAAYTVVAAPHITSFSPPNGKAGSVLTINGTSLASATTVDIGHKQLQIVTDSATMITAELPPTAKSGVLIVTTPGGSARSAGRFKVKR